MVFSGVCLVWCALSRQSTSHQTHKHNKVLLCFTSTSLCVRVCMYVCMYVYIYIYVCMYIYIYIEKLWTKNNTMWRVSCLLHICRIRLCSLGCKSLLEFKHLNAKLNPICHLLPILGAHHTLHVSRIRVKLCSCARGATVNQNGEVLIVMLFACESDEWN